MKVYIFNISLLLCILTFIPNLQVHAQERNQSETVIIESVIQDKYGAPIPNATIYGAEGSKVVYSDERGYFKIIVPESSELVIEAKGYNHETISTIRITEKIILTISSFLQGKKDNVQIPFGKTTKGNIVNTSVVINPEEFSNYDQNISIYNALQVKVPGLIGASNIRGMGDALVVIDGVPRSIDYINLTEVEQITVLKDVNASVLYGTQAKNGVILITTKRGDPLKKNINVRINHTMSFPISFPSYLNSFDYMTLYDEARRNDGLSPIYTDILKDYKTGNPYRYPDMDYYSKELLKNMKNTTEINTEFSGGGKRTRYYSNIGLRTNDALYNLKGSKRFGNNRFNVRGNVDFDITDYIYSYIDAAFILDINTDANGYFWDYGSKYHPNYYSPLLPVNLITDPSLYETSKLIDGKYLLGGTNQYTNNVYGDYLLGGYSRYYQRMAQFKIGFDIDLEQWIRGLSLNAVIGFDFYNTYGESVENSYAVYSPTWNERNDSIVGLEKIKEDRTDGIQHLNRQYFNRNLMLNVGTNYIRSFEGGHNFNATLIGYYNQFQQNSVLLSQKYAHLGLRTTYDYQNKYQADFSSALTNSVRLSSRKKIGYSPTIGLGWIISNENFWNKSSCIDYLKIRFAGGLLHTDNYFNHNLYKETYSVSGTFYWNDLDMDGTRGSITNLYVAGNEKLGYEIFKNMNINIESYLFNKLLYINAGYFQTRHSNKVTKRANYYPTILGAFYPYENYGETVYSGAELGVNWEKRWKDFSVGLGTQFTYATSEVLKVDEVWDNPYQYRKGKPGDALFGLVSNGFFNSKEDIKNAPQQKFGTVVPGDIAYKDQNNDKVIDQNDEVQIGNSMPRYSYGLSINLQYKKFNLFILGRGVAKYNGIYNTSYDWIDGDKKYSSQVLNRWTEETVATSTYPRLSSQENSNNNRTSTFWIYDASYFSLDRIQLTYSFPQAVLSGSFIKKLSLYMNGSNLLMLCENRERRQLNIYSEPQYRNLSLGLQIGF